jgi:hypothetical protein
MEVESDCRYVRYMINDDYRDPIVDYLGLIA